MGKLTLGLFLGFFIGVACRYFAIPLPGPPTLVGALVVLSVTCGYISTDSLLTRRSKTAGNFKRPDTSTRRQRRDVEATKEEASFQ